MAKNSTFKDILIGAIAGSIAGNMAARQSKPTPYAGRTYHDPDDDLTPEQLQAKWDAWEEKRLARIETAKKRAFQQKFQDELFKLKLQKFHKSCEKHPVIVMTIWWSLVAAALGGVSLVIYWIVHCICAVV